MTTPDNLPGGISYAIPIAELPGLVTLLKRGQAWASSNAIELAPDLGRRCRDLEATVKAMRPIAPATFPSPEPLHAVTIEGVDMALSGEEVGAAEAARITGVSRQHISRRLNTGSLPGRRDESGKWWIPVDALKGA